MDIQMMKPIMHKIHRHRSICHTNVGKKFRYETSNKIWNDLNIRLRSKFSIDVHSLHRQIMEESICQQNETKTLQCF